MKTLIAAVAFGALTFVGTGAAQAQQQQTVGDQLVGAWDIQSWTTHHSKGPDTFPFSEHPVGHLICVKVAVGLRCSINVGSADRKSAGAVPTDAEAAQLFKSYNGYTLSVQNLTATPDGLKGIATTDFASVPVLVAPPSGRSYSISGDTLTTLSTPITSGVTGDTVTVTTIWTKEH